MAKRSNGNGKDRIHRDNGSTDWAGTHAENQKERSEEDQARVQEAILYIQRVLSRMIIGLNYKCPSFFEQLITEYSYELACLFFKKGEKINTQKALLARRTRKLAFKRVKSWVRSFELHQEYHLSSDNPFNDLTTLPAYQRYSNLKLPILIDIFHNYQLTLPESLHDYQGICSFLFSLPALIKQRSLKNTDIYCKIIHLQLILGENVGRLHADFIGVKPTDVSRLKDAAFKVCRKLFTEQYPEFPVPLPSTSKKTITDETSESSAETADETSEAIELPDMSQGHCKPVLISHFTRVGDRLIDVTELTKSHLKDILYSQN